MSGSLIVSKRVVLSVKLHPEAEEELFQDAAWYDDQRSSLGDAFLQEVYRWFDIISGAPQVWPLWPGIPGEVSPPIQRVVADRFPYKIAYQELADHVLVVAVAHSSREPLYWAARITQ